ncbi:hypothetical protein GCM10007170_16080 [Arthrobacter liuii]|uniref:IrrE N-terminal-like domain-containing protein n=2 Tax=Arthrobacter liuii TaxID=1476996 RepID=A0ABQ2AMD5_9MICC|nr:hypothetical protein GCM10007170_16080 [Arthrobacter liuii]
MPDGMLGYYDHGTGNIYVDERLDRHARQLTVTHERFHKLLKHQPCGTPGLRVAREMQVERMTAEYFISFRALLDAYKACSDIAAGARILNVDVELVYARINNLSRLERTILEVCAMRCIGVQLSRTHPDGALVP